MVLLAVPDKLCVMTYLHTLRSYFTNQTLEVLQIGTRSSESTYTLGERDVEDEQRVSEEMYGRKDKAPPQPKPRQLRATTSGVILEEAVVAEPPSPQFSPEDSFSARPAVERESTPTEQEIQSSVAVATSTPVRDANASPTKAVRNPSASPSPPVGKSHGKKRPAPRPPSQIPSPPDGGSKLMTRKQLLNPFDSDEEGEGMEGGVKEDQPKPSSQPNSAAASGARSVLGLSLNLVLVGTLLMSRCKLLSSLSFGYCFKPTDIEAY
jgi:hypothetical protein